MYVSDRTPLPKEALVSLFRLCLSSTTFYYNGTVYQQIFDTAMGSPVLVVVANIVMKHIEDLAHWSLPYFGRDMWMMSIRWDQVDGMQFHQPKHPVHF